ncbi:MAG: UDP-N-acetylmuramate dehydrogenase, partial [Candidatus Omnitrophica bacterium]|nr:UDP-N-acetylmuramate dehydrogenase [Candidatus Omnitrophota bacterium]
EPDDTDDLRLLLDISRSEGIPLFLIGRGSNLLVSERGFEGIVVCLGNSFQAGLGLQGFIRAMIDKGYSGLEFMAGIPGTIGGAVKMNAGASLNGPCIFNFIERLKVCDPFGLIRHIEKKDLRFGYRESNLGDLIILEAEFNLTIREREISRKAYDEYLARKKSGQELASPSAGCVFKNPGDSEMSAAQLIEGCALKGRRVGDAMVSPRHANFIVNAGKARFRDVVDLIELIEESVLKKYHIKLEREIKIIHGRGGA